MKNKLEDFWYGRSRQLQAELNDLDKFDEKMKKDGKERFIRLMIVLTPMLISEPIAFFSNIPIILAHGAAITGVVFIIDQAIDRIKTYRRDVRISKPEDKEENYREITDDEANELEKSKSISNSNNKVNNCSKSSKTHRIETSYNTEVLNDFLISLYEFLKSRKLEDYFAGYAQLIFYSAYARSQVKGNNYITTGDIIDSIDLIKPFTHEKDFMDFKQNLLHDLPDCTFSYSDIEKIDVNKLKKTIK